MVSANGGSDVERALLSDVSVDVGWRLIERFSSLVRESGMPDEHAAADYIVSELDRLGIGYAVYEPELYLSLPRGGSVAVEDLPPGGMVNRVGCAHRRLRSRSEIVFRILPDILPRRREPRPTPCRRVLGQHSQGPRRTRR